MTTNSTPHSTQDEGNTAMTDHEIRLWALELVARKTEPGRNTCLAIERIADMVLKAADAASAMRAIEATAKMAFGASAEVLLMAIESTARFLRTGSHREIQPTPKAAEASPQSILE